MTAGILLATVAALLAAAAVSAVPAAGQEDGRSPDQVPRNVHVRTVETGVEIRLPPADGEAAAPVAVGFSTLNGTLDVVHRPGEQDGHLLEVDFEELFEFRDENGNGSYDPGDPVVSAWRVSRAGAEGPGNRTVDWGSPIVTNVTREGLEGKRVVLPAQIGDGGSFELHMVAFGNETEIGGTPLKPTSVAIDLVMRYPFERNGTELGLLLTARTFEDAEIGSAHQAFAPDQEGVVVTRRGAEKAGNLLFAWRNTSTVDGRTEPVATDVLERQGPEEPDETSPQREDRRRRQYGGTEIDIPAANATYTQLALSYDRGQRIAHDGKAEVAVTEIETETGTPGWTAGLAVATLAVAALARRRGG